MAVGLNLIADAVDADVDVYLFDYPGHRPGETPLRTIDDLAARLLRELGAASVTGPLAFYGNSLGSWVVFEAARRLEALGKTPLLVGIGDLYSPYFASKDSPTRPPLWRRVLYRFRRSVTRTRQRARVRTVRHGSVLERREIVASASRSALRSYGTRDYRGALLVIAADRADRFGHLLGWDRHASGALTGAVVQGGHSDMHRVHAGTIGRLLSVHLGPELARRPK
jgi:thioesterase domain-containing protein